MQQYFKIKSENFKHLSLMALSLAFLVIIVISFKNDDIPASKKINTAYQDTDLSIIKNFLLSKIQSPFFNINHEIQKGENIQKILKTYKIKNNEIQSIIEQYKEFGNPNKLLAGNKVEIVIKKKNR